MQYHSLLGFLNQTQDASNLVLVTGLCLLSSQVTPFFLDSNIMDKEGMGRKGWGGKGRTLLSLFIQTCH